MSRFVTVSKNDKNYWPLLLGQFSKHEFAHPIKNLSVNSVNETITFKIVDRPTRSLLKALVQWYSFSRHIYLLFPVLGGLSYMFSSFGDVSLPLVLSSFVSLQFFLIALTLYNDYSDYVNGVDRINDHSSAKPLVQGLVRPYQARQLALAFFVLSLLSAVYCFWVKPLTLLLALIALLFGLSLTSGVLLRKYKGVSLVATFILGGPLLVLGYEFLLYDLISWPAACLGAVFGYHALKHDFTKQVRDMFYSSRAHLVTLTNVFGFERSKALYSLMSLAHLGFLTGFVRLVDRPELYLLLAVSLCFELYINKLFWQAPSFLSSQIGQCLSLQKLHFTIETTLLTLIFVSPIWLSFL